MFHSKHTKQNPYLLNLFSLLIFCRFLKFPKNVQSPYTILWNCLNERCFKLHTSFRLDTGSTRKVSLSFWGVAASRKKSFHISIKSRVARSLEIVSRTFWFSRDAVDYFHGCPQRRQNEFLPTHTPWKLGLRTKKCWKIWSQYLDSDRFHSCDNTLFVGMALTLHKSQLHCSGVMQRWACGSLMSTPPADSRYETCDAGALFYCFS